MKTLKVGALALSVMVAGSALAYPGQQYVAALVAGVKTLPLGYEVGVKSLSLKISDKGYVKTAKGFQAALLVPVTYPKSSAAVATVAVVGVVAYKQYKNYKAKQARMARQLARQAKAEQAETAEEVTLG